MQLSIGSIANIVVLLGIFVRVHVALNKIERRMDWVDEMWLEFCSDRGYPVPEWLLAKFRRVNRPSQVS